MLSADVLVLNHTLFFMLLGGQEEDTGGGLLFKNDFIVFDEAHTVERVASGHIGLSASSGQVRFGLQRLWNPNTGKGLLGILRRGAPAVVEEALRQSEKFFAAAESACDQLAASREGARSRWHLECIAHSPS